MRITITQVCGPSVVFRSDGVKLREEIVRRWSDAEPLEIDFENISIASISFLDEAIAVLALEHPVDVLKRRLKLVNIFDADRRLLNAQILSNARQRAASSEREVLQEVARTRPAGAGRGAVRHPLKKLARTRHEKPGKNGQTAARHVRGDGGAEPDGGGQRE